MAEDLQYWIHDGNIWGAPANHLTLPRPSQAEAAAMPVICGVDNWRVEDQLNDYSACGDGGFTVDPSCFGLTGFDLLQSAQGTWHDQDISQSFCGRPIERSRSAFIQEEEEVNPKRYKLSQETTSAWSPNNFSESISPSKESTVEDESGGDRGPWNSSKIEPTWKRVSCNNSLGPSAAFLSSFQSADDHSNSITSANNSRERMELLSSFVEELRSQKACNGDSLCVMDDDYLLRRVRMEASSPLPTFKVRKEKLGDRVTALQQLVSPFGKTDTASVLHEAVQYIELLHNQILALSSPYMKHPETHRQQPFGAQYECGPRLDLRSRGLCLMPISSGIPVDSYEIAANPAWPATVSENSN